MKSYYWLFYGLSVLILKSTWFGRGFSVGFDIDWICLAVIFLALEEKGDIIIVLILGALQDAISFAPMGTSILAYVILFLCIRTALRLVTLQTPFAQFVWISVFSFLGTLLYRLFVLGFSGFHYFQMASWLHALLNAFGSGGAGLGILWLIQKFYSQKVQSAVSTRL